MYWPEHWDKGLRASASPAARKGDGLLDAVIDNTGSKSSQGQRSRPVRVKFPTPAFESRFKSCLAKVPVDCRMEREGSKRVLALRPKNLQRFDELIRTSGLSTCEPVMKAVQFLRANPTEFIRFESH